MSPFRVLLSIFTELYNHHSTGSFNRWNNCLFKNLFLWLKVLNMGFLHSCELFALSEVCVCTFSRGSVGELWDGLWGLTTRQEGTVSQPSFGSPAQEDSSSGRPSRLPQPPATSSLWLIWCSGVQAGGEVMLWTLRLELMLLCRISDLCLCLT